MAWTTRATHVTGYLVTASDWNESVNNDAEEPPAKVTTKGDLTPASAANALIRLAAGTNGYVLITDSAQSGGMKWGIDPALDLVTTAGDILYATAADVLARLGIGAATTVLHGGASAPSYGQVVYADMSSGFIVAGTYLPTLTNGANVAASTAYNCNYVRVGSVVMVSGRVDIDPTSAATATQLGMSLPIASNIGANEDCAGTIAANAIQFLSGAIYGDVANDRANIHFVSDAGAANNSFFFSFIYRII